MIESDLYKRLATDYGKPAMQLLPSEVVTESYFGGVPATAAPIEWPRKDGRPLSFLGQLDLKSLPLVDVAPWLPAKGRLLFFFDMDESPWGFEPDDKGGFIVIHDTGEGRLNKVELPEDLEEEFRLPGLKYLKGRCYTSIPSDERMGEMGGELSEEDEDEYYELHAELFDQEPQHQIGGYPVPVQGDMMEEECQLASGGVYCGNAEEHESELAQQLRAQENDWSLLLQMDTDDDLEIMWGDSGMLYFWVRERDARAGDFSNIWMVLQCC